ncbi:MAG: Fe-S cluster assembly protein SufD [bacterium]|nr:Fe-S cluster assembly protein SufD [bacterium]
MFDSAQQPLTLLGPYEAVKEERWAHTPAWLSAVREEGRHFFESKGLPTRRQEEWKYTDVSVLSQLNFAVPVPSGPGDPGKGSLEKRSLPESSPRLVFVDGFYSSTLSRLDTLPEGVEIGSLAAVIEEGRPMVEEHLAGYGKPYEDSFVALNDAFIEDGAWIYIPDGVRFSEPVHLVYLSTGNGEPGSRHPRNLVIAGKGGAVTVIEEYMGDAGAVYFNNPVTEIVVGDGAEVSHYKVQRESAGAFHIATIEVRQGEGSRFDSHNISFGGQLTRNNIHSYLNGPGSSCTLNGLFMIDGTRHVDNHTLIHHGAPDCRSSELYHGILNDGSRGVFNGKIYVEPGAQRTDSQQTNRSLMLSNDAAVDAKPQLEIFADDVKCTHGATIGQIDDDALYYMRSRGISPDDARKMLTSAFARQVTDMVGLEPLRKALEKELTSHLEK